MCHLTQTAPLSWTIFISRLGLVTANLQYELLSSRYEDIKSGAKCRKRDDFGPLMVIGKFAIFCTFGLEMHLTGAPKIGVFADTTT